jgi:hypothetical protein
MAVWLYEICRISSPSLARKQLGEDNIKLANSSNNWPPKAWPLPAMRCTMYNEFWKTIQDWRRPWLLALTN